jgi:clan AA aspartic protease
MGQVHTEIVLINGQDILDGRRHLIGEEEIRHMRVVMLADTGAYSLSINENIQAYLQLPFQERKRCELADGRILECDVVGPVFVRYGNRNTTCNAVVLPGNSEPLLGAIPMEEMDIFIDMRRQELVPNPKHPDGAVLRL